MKTDNRHITPPKLAEKILLWFLKEDLAEEVLGDLDEKFYTTLNNRSKSKAKRNYWYQVFNYLRPFAFKFFRSTQLTKTTMLSHNLKISWRHMLKNKAYSFINVGGLALGMVVTLLIGLWINDELSFNKYHENYNSMVQLMRHDQRGNETNTNQFLATGMGTILRNNFPDQIENVVMMRARTQSRVLANGDLKFTQEGLFLEKEGPSLLSLKMKYGDQNGLKEIKSILLSESLAEKLFGNENPISKLIKMDASLDLIVTGVYEDLPQNSTFSDATYMTRLLILWDGDESYLNVWNNYNVYAFAQVNPKADLHELSALVDSAIQPNVRNNANDRSMKFFLHPMKDWHLNSEFQNGEQVTSAQKNFVWLYGSIGLFVLILASINFMNLSTARSEKRAKEVGIRKTLGSVRKQLIAQFYIESFLYCLLAFAFSIVLFWALLPWFNETSGKAMLAPWSSINFWLICSGFILMTAFFAGSYPAIYLSSFNPIKAMKGTFAGGKWATLPRKILVVFQFTISIALIIGTITVNNQIQTAKNRPLGYSPKGMLSLRPASPNFGKQKEVLKSEILKTGMASAIGTSNYPVISTLGWNGGFTWEGMEPNFDESFNTISISHGYGDAVGMEFVHGRDFSEAFETDRNGIIINESAMKAMNLENPIGTLVNYNPGWAPARNYTIVGVVKDMIKGSPFQETDQSIMFLGQEFTSWLYIRLNPSVSASEAIPKIEAVFNNILPEAPFDYKFADDDYFEKFETEERIGDLASFFTILAIIISCLGLFGLASYMAEQRSKEIGIRKVLGANVLSLWQILSKDFALLVLTACLIAVPLSYKVLDGWLNGYPFRTQLYWWVFASAGLGALIITLITVSFQAIKTALANPVKSLRSE